MVVISMIPMGTVKTKSRFVFPGISTAEKCPLKPMYGHFISAVMHSVLLIISFVNEVFKKKKKRCFEITHTPNSRTAVCIQTLWKGTSQVLGVGTGQTAWSALAVLFSPASCPHTLSSKLCSSDANWLTEQPLWRESLWRSGGGAVDKYFINLTENLIWPF